VLIDLSNMIMCLMFISPDDVSPMIRSLYASVEHLLNPLASTDAAKVRNAVLLVWWTSYWYVCALRTAMKTVMRVRCSLMHACIFIDFVPLNDFIMHQHPRTTPTLLSAAPARSLAPTLQPCTRFIELMARFDLIPPAFQRVQHAHVEWYIHTDMHYCSTTPRIIRRQPLTRIHARTSAV